MADFLFLMHGDGQSGGDWGKYLARLEASGCFRGGSAVSEGVCVAKSGVTSQVTEHITGYIKIEADDLAHAQTFVAGNPVYETGGTVEIRELPKDD